MPKTTETDGRMLIANESFIMNFDGSDRTFVANVTRIREGHPMLEGREHLFRPIDAHYDVEAASAAPGEKRGA